MKSKKRVLLHIASSEAAKSLFTIAGLCAFKVKLGNNLIASCCGKVNIQFNSSLQSIIGYIIEERHGRWSMLLKDNSIITS